MRSEILTAFKKMVEALTGKAVVIGSLPPLNGFAVSFAGGFPRAAFWPLTSDQDLPIQFTGKGANQQELSALMDIVHMSLTTAQNLPFAEDWQIYAIETTSAPQLIGREENQNYIYGSSFRIKFYAR